MAGLIGLVCILSLCMPSCLSSRLRVDSEQIPGTYEDKHGSRLALGADHQFELQTDSQTVQGRWALGEAFDYYLCEGDQLLFLRSTAFSALGHAGLKAHFEKSSGKVVIGFDNAGPDLKDLKLVRR